MSDVSEACGAGDAGRALVPGSLRGYRTWRLLRRRTSVPDDGLPLTSVTRRGVVWGPSLTARCTPSDTGTARPWSPTLDGDHQAPHAGCSCGVYAWYAPTDTGMVSARVFGVVEASGLILMGERGFRAQTVKIAGVVTRNRRVTTACTRAGIPVYRRRRDLLRDYPPDDLSSLLGDVHGHEPPPAAVPQAPLLFDGLACLAVWGRAGLVAAALIFLPTAPAVTVALVTHLAVFGLIATRLHR
jgi:hypothetical protein